MKETPTKQRFSLIASVITEAFEHFAQ